jgi:hypothetical protein
MRISLQLLGIGALLMMGSACGSVSPSVIESNLPAVFSKPLLGEPFLTTEMGKPPPPLNVAERKRLYDDGERSIQFWVEAAQAGKTTRPTDFTESLQAFRAESQVANAAIAPFIGLWQETAPDSGYPADLSRSRKRLLESAPEANYPYYLNIFPAKEANQVCILRYRRQGDPPSKVLPSTAQTAEGREAEALANIAPPIFELSKATIVDGNLLGDRVRTTSDSVQVKPFYGGNAEFLAIDASYSSIDPIEVFSLADQPVILASFSPHMREELARELPAKGCTTEILTAVEGQLENSASQGANAHGVNQSDPQGDR